ncbi:BrnA antitoxin family protein [Bartonella queenslandensis]|uniref:BrnA antitoxin family protein n=1 Tax=Bartonella queenslandensis TaxID=481138 RepID=UPI003CC74602
MMTKYPYIKPLTDEEEAEIQKEIAHDPDAPEATDEQIAQAKSFAEVFPDLAESIKRSRGRPQIDNPKEQVSIRLSPDVLKKLKAFGRGWQSKVDDILRKAVGL